MSESTLINSAEFARDAQQLDGEVPVSGLVRTHESLADATGTIIYSLKGGTDSFGRPTLKMKVSGTVRLVCQRCLQAMEQKLDSESVLTLFDDEATLDAAAEEDEDLEGILADRKQSVVELIEDEILLALPLAPRHEQCGSGMTSDAATAKPNPFAVLKKLQDN